MARRSRTGSHRANATAESYHTAMDQRTMGPECPLDRPSVRRGDRIPVSSSPGRPEGPSTSCVTIFRFYCTLHGIHTSDAPQEGHAGQDGTGSVPRARAPACDPGNLRGFVRVKFRNIRSGTSGGPEAALRRLGRARHAGRAADAVPVSGWRRLLLHGHELVRADPHLQRGARGVGQLPEVGDDDPGGVLR